MEQKKRIFSGIQPSGDLTLGSFDEYAYDCNFAYSNGILPWRNWRNDTANRFDGIRRTYIRFFDDIIRYANNLLHL